jgi:hypothetical protein
MVVSERQFKNFNFFFPLENSAGKIKFECPLAEIKKKNCRFYGKRNPLFPVECEVFTLVKLKEISLLRFRESRLARQTQTKRFTLHGGEGCFRNDPGECKR